MVIVKPGILKLPTGSSISSADATSSHSSSPTHLGALNRGYTHRMDQLWTPWRYAYVSTADDAQRQGVPAALSGWKGDHHCVFCNMIAAVEFAEKHGISADQAEREAGIVRRAAHTFVCLNAFPYATGHVMIVPYRHEHSLAALETSIAHEMMDTAQQTERALAELYSPHGMNFGLNLGKAAGAGVAGHLHLHALPRWTGDTNFMTTVGETRILPESLEITWERMRSVFPKEAALAPPSRADR